MCAQLEFTTESFAEAKFVFSYRVIIVKSEPIKLWIKFSLR